MHRRYFLLSITGPFALRAVPRPPVRITRITLCPIEGRFHKFVIMNAYAAEPNAHTYSNTLVRISTDQGMEGIGVMDYSAPDDAFRLAAKSLIGSNPLELYEMNDGRIVGPSARYAAVLKRYSHLDGP